MIWYLLIGFVVLAWTLFANGKTKTDSYDYEIVAAAGFVLFLWPLFLILALLVVAKKVMKQA